MAFSWLGPPAAAAVSWMTTVAPAAGRHRGASLSRRPWFFPRRIHRGPTDGSRPPSSPPSFALQAVAGATARAGRFQSSATMGNAPLPLAAVQRLNGSSQLGSGQPLAMQLMVLPGLSGLPGSDAGPGRSCIPIRPPSWAVLGDQRWQAGWRAVPPQQGSTRLSRWCSRRPREQMRCAPKRWCRRLAPGSTNGCCSLVNATTFTGL